MDWAEYLRLKKLNLLTKEKIEELFLKCIYCGAAREYQYNKYCKKCLEKLGE